jgi:hypothetical protein
MRAARFLANGACAGILGLAAATALLAQPGQRGYSQIYNFDGVVGLSPLTGTGNSLYGATQAGGSLGMGNVYALTLPATPGDPWTYTSLYDFGVHASDGIYAFGITIGGSSGGLPILYGVTNLGGEFGNGTVFCLVPPQTPGGTWTEHVLYSFSGVDGQFPEAPLVLGIKTSGLPVIYGTSVGGGTSGQGTVFSLAPPTTPGGKWTESVLYSFGNTGLDAFGPDALTIGSGPGGAPVLYGLALAGGGNGGGVIFSLTEAGGTWTYDVIYNRPPRIEDSSPTSLSMGSDGVLYGTVAPDDGLGNLTGFLYSLTPPASEGGMWTENTLYSFDGPHDGLAPVTAIMGSNGTLYGVTEGGGFGHGIGDGSVFSLAPPASPGGSWTEEVLYSFPVNDETGGPNSLIIGPHGALYGTTSYGVSVVFAVVP